jgi:hypothetical protein
MEVDEKGVFPSVRSDPFQQLHPSLFMQWEKISHIFLTCPSEEHAGSG